MKTLIEKIKNFKNNSFDEEFLQELNNSNLIQKIECFGDNSDTSMCVRIVKIDGKNYYVCDGFEWITITDNVNEVIELFDNDFECKEENKECINKKEKYIEKLKNFLNN